MAKRWMQKIGLKHAALSRQLGIPISEDIPMKLLNAIRTAKIGDTISNPTKSGKRTFKVTRLLKKRAVLAITLKKTHHKR